MTSIDPSYYTLEHLTELFNRQNQLYNITFICILPFTAISFYLIVFHSKEMKAYRFYVLYYQFACFFCDANVAIGTKTFPLFPLPLVCFNGLFTYFGVSAKAQMCSAAFCLELTGAATNSCFLYRHQIIAGIRKVRKLGRKGYFAAMLMAHFWLTAFIFYAFPTFDKEKLFQSLTEKYPFIVDVGQFEYLTFGQNDVELAVSIPLAVVVVPVGMMLACAANEDWPLRDFSTMALWVASTHSFFSTATMFFTTPHYWKSTLKNIRRVVKRGQRTSAKQESLVSVGQVRPLNVLSTRRSARY